MSVAQANSLSELNDAVQQVNAEAGGILNLQIVQFEDIIGLMADAFNGNANAHHLLNAAKGAVDAVRNAPRRAPVLCGCCPRAVRKSDRFCIAVALPHRDDPHQGLTFVLCEKCRGDGTGLPTKAGEALKRIWPQLRQIELEHHAEGHA